MTAAIHFDREAWNQDRAFYLFLLAYWIAWFFCFEPKIVNPDGVGYYAYGRSLLLEGNFSLRNEFEEFRMWRYFYDITPLGHMKNVFAFGSSLLWFPFLIVAHGLASLGEAAGGGVQADGYSSLYIYFLNLGTAFYGFFALVLSYRLAAHFVSRSAAMWATVLVWTLSSFWHYAFFEGSLSHITTAFSLALFLFLFVRTRGTAESRSGFENSGRSPAAWFLLGLAAGLTALVRWQNVIFPIMVAAKLLWDLIGAKARRITFGPITVDAGWGRAGSLRDLSLFGAGVLAILFPQIMVWKIYFGSWITLPQGEGFFHWGDPYLFKALLSSHHGLFSWTPVVLFSVFPGLLLFLRRDRTLGIYLIVAFLVQVYINSVVYDVEAGVSYGARRFVGYSSIYILGLACFLAVIPRLAGVVLTVILAVYNGLLWLAFQHLLIDPQLYVSFGQMFRSIGRAAGKLPELLERIFSYHAFVFIDGSFGFVALVIFSTLAIALLALWFAVRQTGLGSEPGDLRRSLRIAALVCATLVGLFDIGVVAASGRTRPAPVAVTFEGRAAMLDFAWYANAKYDLDPFQPNWYHVEKNHFPDLEPGELSWRGVPFLVLPPAYLPRSYGSVITTCYEPESRFEVPLEPRETRALHLALDGGLCFNELIVVGYLTVEYAAGPPVKAALMSGVDVWDYLQSPPPEATVWSGESSQEITGYTLEIDSTRVPTRLLIEGIPKLEDRRNNPGIVVFAVTQELSFGVDVQEAGGSNAGRGESGANGERISGKVPGAGRFVPIDIREIANADYHQDPFAPGLVENHFPDLEPGVIRYQGKPFMILDPESPPERGTVITTAYLRTHRVRLPLLEAPTREIIFLIDGGLMKGLRLHATDLVVEYHSGPEDRFEIWSGSDVQDYWEEGPAERMAWRGGGPQSLTYFEARLDRSRVPRYLWIEGVVNQGVLGMNAGVAVFAITQMLERAPGES